MPLSHITGVSAKLCQETSDFDRFQIQLAKRSRRDQVGKAYTKEKKASA